MEEERRVRGEKTSSKVDQPTVPTSQTRASWDQSEIAVEGRHRWKEQAAKQQYVEVVRQSSRDATRGIGHA